MRLKEGESDWNLFFDLVNRERRPIDSFGAFFFNKRDKGLNDFCKENGIEEPDDYIIFLIEYDMFVPSDTELCQYAAMLNIQEGTPDWDTFFRLAAESLEQHPERAIIDPADAWPLEIERNSKKYIKELIAKTEQS